MSMELWGGVAVHRTGSVMLKLGRDEATRRLRWVFAADACVRVALQLCKRSRHRVAMCFSDTVVPAHKCGKRDRLGSGKRRIPTGAMLDGFRNGTICVGLLRCDAMANHLLAGCRVLPVCEGKERFLAHLS